MAWRANRSGGGYSLIEIIVVLSLLGVLVAIALPIYGGAQRRSQRLTCLSNLRAISAALSMYRDDYRAYPPDRSEAFAGKRGLGLLYLNYLAENPDAGGDPATANYTTAAGDYLRSANFLNCPANPTERADFEVVKNGDNDAAYLGGFNAYDWYYRRDWDAYLTSLGGAFSGGWPGMGQRHLKGDYAPDNTVVTWCTMHRNAPPRSTLEGLQWTPHRDDRDLVLFVDGTVGRFPSGTQQYAARHP